MAKQNEFIRQLRDKLTDEIQCVLDEYGGEEQEFRSVFEKEYDKVIFSDYFRALSDKTQVVPLSEEDHNHNRLTHSLEVASVGRSLGTKLANWLIDDYLSTKVDLLLAEEEVAELATHSEALKHLPIIIETACLLHDIGNPPFGHAGEDAIKHVFESCFKEKPGSNGEKFEHIFKNYGIEITKAQREDFTRFDGNANGFRIATRLAGKREANELPLDDKVRLNSGLGLSKITLASGFKYPFPAGMHPSKDKYGYFQSEETIFKWISNILPKDNIERNEIGCRRRHPLVYLVEAADDICNIVMDFEDAVKNGHTEANRLAEDILIGIFKFKREKISNFLYPEDELTRIHPSIVKDFIKNLGLESIKKGRKAQKQLNERAENIIKNIMLLRDYDSNKPISPLHLKAMEGIRAEVIGMLIRAAFKCFQINIKDILKGEIYSNNESSGLLDKHFSIKAERAKAIDDLKTDYLKNSLYCHKRKAEIEISGYQITEYLLPLFLDSIAEFKHKEFGKCSTRTQHLLRHLGYGPKSQPEVSDYNACLKIIDFYTKASDREISVLYQKLSGYKY